MIDPKEELKAYLDGELTPLEAEQVRLALLNDPDMANEAEQLRAISATLAQEKSVQPVGLDETLEAVRRHKAWWRQPSIAWPAAVSIAGAIAMAIFLTAVLMPAGSNSTSFATRFSPRREADSSVSEMSEKAAMPRQAAAAKVSGPTSRDKDLQEQSVQSMGMTAEKGHHPLVLNQRKVQGRTSAAIAIDLQNPAQADRFLKNLSKQPAIVAIKREPQSTPNELSVTVTYKSPVEAVQAFLEKPRARANMGGMNFGWGSFRLHVTLVPAKR